MFKRICAALTLALLGIAAPLIAAERMPAANQRPAAQPTAQQQFSAMVGRVLDLIEPPAGAKPKTVSLKAVVVKGVGLPAEVVGKQLELAYQAPDHLRIALELDGAKYLAARNGNEIWAYNVAKRFAILAVDGVPMFSTMPQDLDKTVLPDFRLPMGRMQLALGLLAINAEAQPPQQIDGAAYDVLKLSFSPTLAELAGVKSGEMRVWIRRSDGLPTRFAYAQGRVDVTVELRDLEVSEPWPAAKWALQPRQGDTVQKVALGHTLKLMDVATSALTEKVPSLPPATGQRRLVATEGKGRLEMHDGTRVLFLEGTPAEIGRQHGVLLRRQVRDVEAHMLWGVGVGTSLPKGQWFFGRMEEAQRRLEPFISKDLLEEIDAMSEATGTPRAEGRLANLFPELFHCSGFAVMGDATVGGRLYHGRILDYLRNLGLEQNAVVAVYRPQGKHAWVNLGYAGFVGSVTAMNEKHIAIGEMGGGGEGRWDGVPMAQLLRNIMEQASTLDEAISIMRNSKRTCEYYYVISDGNTRRAVGVYATPDKFETVGPGEFHPQLARPVKDAVLLSAGKRYETLVDRVKAGYGKLDAEGARHLMDRPVAMSSNIQSVLFAPETLDFWVANADSANVASHTRYTHYNLRELLDSKPAGR